MEQKNEGLQAGRAVAALSVAYFHSYLALRYFQAAEIHPFVPLADAGFLGVDFFFAISGFVISVVTDRPNFSAVPFLIKRFFRLYPLVIVFCLLQFWLHAKSIVDVTADHSWQRILYGMTLLPGSGERYYAVTWTLEREIIFYVLAAIVVPIAGRSGLGAILLVLATAAYFVKTDFDNHVVTMIHADFLAGMLAYQYQRQLRSVGAIAPLLCSPLFYWLGMRGHVLAIPAGSFLAVVGFVNLSLPWARWRWRVATELGNASYSIYLSHWIILYLSNRLAWGIEPTRISAEAWRFGTLGVICFVSVLLWHGFEQPINAFGHRLATRHWRRSVQPLTES
jgi:exopolysaccharide production protein ExoZ